MNDLTISTAQPERSIRAATHPIGWLRGEIDRLFDDFNINRSTRSFFNLPASFDTLHPAADFVDDGKEYRLSVELPGLKQDDINVEYREGTLTISGEKKEEIERNEEGCILSERRFGSFRRQMTLPSDIDPDAIKANYKDGILTLTLSKDENPATRPRKIQIG